MCKKLMFLTSLVLFVLASSGLADDYDWEGNSPYSQLWVDPLNWDPPGGPGPGDTAKLEPGFPGDAPVVLVNNSVGEIKGPRREEDGDMTLEIVGGWLQLSNRWEMVDGSESGISIINIGLGIGFGDPCVHMNNGFEAFRNENDAGEVYLNIGGNSYVLSDDNFKAFTDDKDMPGYFEMNIGGTATVDVKEMRFGDDTTLSESQLTVSGSATLNVFDGELRHSDSDVMRILITDDAEVYVDNTFRGADGDAGSDETHITGNAHLVANRGWESQDGTTLWTVDGNALVEVFDNDMYWRNGSLNVGGTAEVLVEKDIQHNEKITVFNMYDCGPHVVCEGLGLPSDSDSTFATFNLHGGLIEIGQNGLYHDDDDWLLDICGCGVMTIEGDKVDEIMEDHEDGHITVCGYGPCGGPADLMVVYDPCENKTTVWAEEDPNSPYDPDPPCDGCEDDEKVEPDQCLSWVSGQNPCAGQGDLSHAVFLSTNYDKVANAPQDLSALVAILDEEVTTYCPGPLALGACYYWRVVEYCPCETTIGDIWCFCVEDCMVVEDMESYDESCGTSALWEIWKDGAGDCNGIGGNGTGSSLYVATDPVHGGSQSMEYMYDSTGSEREGYWSEIQKIYDPPLNLVDNFEEALVMYFYGQADNDSESMWAVLGDASSNEDQSTYGVYGDDPDDIKVEDWEVWAMGIAGQFPSVDVSEVNRVILGFGPRFTYGPPEGNPALPTGTVYFDDIGLCTTICITKYAPDGDVNDDCVVDWEDIELLADDFLDERL